MTLEDLHYLEELEVSHDRWTEKAIVGYGSLRGEIANGILEHPFNGKLSGVFQKPGQKELYLIYLSVSEQYNKSMGLVRIA